MAQALQQRQGEAGGFTGTGLGRRHHIPALKHRWNALALDRRWGSVALGRHRLHQWLGEPKGGKISGQGRRRSLDDQLVGATLQGRVGGFAIKGLGKAAIGKPPHLPGGWSYRCRRGAQATGPPTGAGAGGGAGRGNQIKFEGTSTVGGATGGACGLHPPPLAGSPRAAGPATAPQPTASTPTGRGPKGS